MKDLLHQVLKVDFGLQDVLKQSIELIQARLPHLEALHIIASETL